MPRLSLIPLLTGGLGQHTFDESEINTVSLNRREFGGALVGIAAAAGLSQVKVPAKVDLAHVRHLHGSVAKLYAKDQILGGGALKFDGLRLYYRARRMLDDSDYSDTTGRLLIAATGDLAVCVGWLCHDANDHVSARTLYLEARLLADQSGDHGLAIRAMEKMSLQLVAITREKKNPAPAREAVRLSRRAAELARDDPSPELHALLAAREAIAHAAIGDRPAFTIAMTRAWRELDRREPTDLTAWLQFVNESEIRVHEAKGESFLGNPDAAAALYRSSLDADLSMRNNANYRAQLAAALAAGGDLQSAVAEGMVVLPRLTNERIESPRTISELKPVRQNAAQHPSFSSFCDRYDRATATSP